ncbi:MAG: hypothetical protein PHI06_13340 [Desulfobulbaceae bacterium]|nr:hypothetical protein [Desulfobulbaceae bacterium]
MTTNDTDTTPQRSQSPSTVTLFQPYAFSSGQKIRIVGGKRAGDWEVLAISERKVTLRCPISGREFEWENFCYLVEEKDDEPWPATA